MKYTLLFVLFTAACLAVPSAARGGRGRGGGSVGGLFGGWRKYKKPSSSGSGRRVMNGSPVHTAMTVPKPPPPPPKPIAALKPSYPRQQLPPGYSYPALGGTGPGQGTFYTNAQALPAGAVYYAQPPMRSSGGTGDFLTGMLAGHMMNSMLFGRRQHVTHVYHGEQEGAAQGQAGGRQIIVINNGEQLQLGEEMPLATEVPPNESLNPLEATSSDEEATSSASQELQESGEATGEATVAAPAAGGIICFPIMLNETDPENADLVREVERVVCFPAPSEPLPLPPVECETRIYTEADPTDPEKTIEVERQECADAEVNTTTTEPPIVAGDIGGGAAVEVASFVAGRAGSLHD